MCPQIFHLNRFDNFLVVCICETQWPPWLGKWFTKPERGKYFFVFLPWCHWQAAAAETHCASMLPWFHTYLLKVFKITKWKLLTILRLICNIMSLHNAIKSNCHCYHNTVSLQNVWISEINLILLILTVIVCCLF